jgi:foldase protein PrsA
MLSKSGRGLVLAGLVVALLTVLVGCGSRPAAIVNGQKITENDLNKRLRATDGKQVLSQLIETRIVHDAFVKAGLTVTDEDVNEAITERFGSKEAFQQQAAQAGINTDQYIEDSIKPQIMMEKLATAGIKYTDADLQEFYQKNKDEYNVPERVTLRIILAPDKTTADKVMTALKGGANFASLVTQYSIDPKTRETGGLIPNLDLKQAPELASPVNALKEGAYSQPIAVQDKWLIVKLEKRQAAETRTYDQVKTDVKRDFLRSKLDSSDVSTLRDKLHRDARVQVVAPEFQSLNEEFQSAKMPAFGGKSAAGQPGKPGAAAGGAAPAGQAPPGQALPAQPPAGQAPAGQAAPPAGGAGH